MAAFGARVEIIFAHILVFPACAIEVQHTNENSPSILPQGPSINFAALLFFLSGLNRQCIFELNSIA